MEDGFRAIVKIPYWISVLKRYATASEVATLTFLRSKGIPVPEVYGWPSITENPVGVEYIIMEHAPGVRANTRWFDNTDRQKLELVTGVVDIEKELMGIPFGAVGSLYFKNDVSPQFQGPLYAPGTPDEAGDSETYCIGPIADRTFWYGRRADLELDRGPWSDPKNYLLAIAEKEIKWTKKFGKPLELDFPHNTVFRGVISPQDYLELLKQYLSIAPYLLPADPSNTLSRPTLRHPDLTVSSVFICPDTFKVKCIIGWHHTVITPMLLAAGLEPPKYPSNYDTMGSDERAQVDELMNQRSFFHLYRVFNGGLNEMHLAVLNELLRIEIQGLALFANRQWCGNLMSLRRSLVRIPYIWDSLPGKDGAPECPIEFSENEVRDQIENERIWLDLNRMLCYWTNELGGPSEEGWLPAEKYDAAVKGNKLLRAQLLDCSGSDESGKIERGWLFQDH
ncbi:hypothetical protein PHISCL_04319 [Aspergillus sclerotialis]|uniref:Phosphotransferase enzyme family n=1 Tax=Aspergillus sclerotialis TaxID=2070753 RepID=A0A3A2ZM07_9EURO|nr:hypothetical protein PHISCL_04319 [Aspergillus sclerotialis]